MKSILRLLAPFILGLLVGGTGMTVYLGGQIDQLIFRVQTLKEEIGAAEQQIAELEKNIANRHQQTVTSIKVNIKFSDNLTKLEKQTARLEMEKKVKQWLDPLYGQEVNSLNHQMIYQIVNERIVEVEGKLYQLYTRVIYLGENIVIYLEAKRKQPEVPY
ncbi:MAG: hypothetical protein H0Z39_04415 [Peptococcaceae bacterium]|nr:hypothetical protein [Peptococcaceae bacterium]